MTRDEFIDGYMERSGLNSDLRTDDGFRLGRFRRIALPCACGEKGCDGWAMILDEPEYIVSHNRLYAPTIGQGEAE